MRALTLSLSAIGMLLLLLVADLRWGFVRLPLVGFESGLIVASMSLFAGIGASATATLLAFLQLRRTASVSSSRLLLVWCCALLLGFGVIIVV
jgi:hypothetical protein